MVPPDGRSSYALGYFRALSDTELENDAQEIENRFAGMPEVKLGGQQVANEQVNTQVSHDLAHAELLAFPLVFLLSLLFFRSLVAALAAAPAGRSRDRLHLPGAAHYRH